MTPLDKKLQKATSARERKARTADKLVRVRMLSGLIEWILLHVEVQSQQQQGFAKRMFDYNARLHERYGASVNSLAILGDENPNWKPSTYSYGEISRTSIEYPIAKLTEQNRVALEASDNPFVMMVLAHFAAQETRNQPQRRADVKVELARMLVAKGFSREQFDTYMALADWLMAVPSHMENQTTERIRDVREEAYSMRPVPIVERMYRQEGRVEGKLEGLRAGINALINVRFKEPGVSLKEEIAAIKDPDMLQTILEGLETAQTLDEVRTLVAKAAEA